MFEDIENCARGYLELDLLEEHEEEGKKYKFLGIYAKNREEYIVAELAGHHLAATIVPLYDTLGLDGLDFIMKQTNLRTIFTSAEGLINMEKMENGGVLPMSKNIIVFDQISEEFGGNIKEKFPHLRLLSFADVLLIGRNSGRELREDMRATPETIGLLCYTSGTTGLPKGAMLSHKNMVAGASGLAYNKYMREMNNTDSYISYLPMAHVLERILITACYICGMKIGFFNGNITKLANDFAVLHPTSFGSVPRLYYRFYSLLKQKMSELKGFKKKLLEKALQAKLEKVRKTAIPTHQLYDLLLFKKMKAVVGGQIKFMASGGAPIDRTVLEFLKVCFCCPIMEGYGQTESFASGSSASYEDPGMGHTGPPFVCMEMKLVDVPEMEYFIADQGQWEGEVINIPRGELLMRGPAVFQGYFKDPVKTSEALKDGWLHTGDIAKFIPRGRVAIIDRKNNFFKLSQGEYIAAEKLENVYSMSNYVTQIYVYGDGLRDYLVAIIVPDEQFFLKRAKKLGIIYIGICL